MSRRLNQLVCVLGSEMGSQETDGGQMESSSGESVQ